MINPSALGIIFPNLHDENLPELVGHRAMASVPFAGRYRLIDFPLSGMTGAGIENVAVIARKNFQSLMDHLGNGREWDLSRKRGGLVLFPPYARVGSEVYRGRIQALASIIDYLEYSSEELVVMCDCDAAYNLNYRKLLDFHRTSGADVTMLYDTAEITEGLKKDNVAIRLSDEGRVTDIRVNEYRKGPQKLALNLYVLRREFLINIVREATVKGETKFVLDFLAKNLKACQIMGYEFTGYRARIYDMQSYFRESLRLLNPKSIGGLFPAGQPIYTKVRDEAPVRYAIGSHVEHSLVADGCIIEGEVESCVIFRGVRIRKGARLKNCVVMQGSDVGPNVVMENVITDKDVFIGAGQKLRGAASFPVFIAKGCQVL